MTSRGFRGAIAVNGIIGVMHVGVSLLFVYVCKHLIDIVTRHSADNLKWYVGAMIVCMGMQLLLSVVSARMGSSLDIRFRNELRYRLFCRVMESKWAGKGVMHTGDMLNRMGEDVLTVTGAVCRSLPALLTTVVQLGGAWIFLYQLDKRLAWILLLVMPVALLLSKSYVRKMRRLTKEIRATDSRVQSHLQENLQHRVLIRTLEYTSCANQTLSVLQEGLQNKVMERTNFSVFSRLMVQTGFAVGYATAFLWGLYGMYGGTVTFGMMTAFLQLVSQVQRPMVDLSRQIPAFVQVFTSVERLQELAALDVEKKGKSHKMEGKLGVRLEKVCFAYSDGERKVMDNFSCNFAPGSLTAIVGETGVGKSTLIRLMLALLQPDSGRVVLYNEKEEVEASPQTRCNISYVPQGNTLVSGTIRDNLLLGNPKATEEELRAALHTAVADFVLDLPEGLDTLCGELGAGLSEGQAQRIAIARGLLRPGRILILDEPSSALDSETEQLLLERLTLEVKDKTLMLITHRETIGQLCTSVIRMQKKV